MASTGAGERLLLSVIISVTVITPVVTAVITPVISPMITTVIAPMIACIVAHIMVALMTWRVGVVRHMMVGQVISVVGPLARAACRCAIAALGRRLPERGPTADEHSAEKADRGAGKDATPPVAAAETCDCHCSHSFFSKVCGKIPRLGMNSIDLDQRIAGAGASEEE